MENEIISMQLSKWTELHFVAQSSFMQVLFVAYGQVTKFLILMTLLSWHSNRTIAGCWQHSPSTISAALYEVILFSQERYG
jgi:hypothetical protein